MTEKNLNELTTKLIDIKQKMEHARTERDELSGRLKGEYIRLDKEFSCKTLKEAKKIYDELKIKKEVDLKKLDLSVSKLEDEMESIEI